MALHNKCGVWPLSKNISTLYWCQISLQDSTYPSSRILPPSGVTTGPLLPWILWALWTAKNNKIFKNQSSTEEETIVKAIQEAKEWIKARNISYIISSPQEEERSTLPAQGMRCLSDAAWRSDTRDVGLGWIIYDQNNNEIAKGSSGKARIANPLMAEALAMREALLQAPARGLRNLSVASDFKQLITLITSRTIHINIYGIIQDIFNLAIDLKISSFNFIPRKKTNWPMA